MDVAMLGHIKAIVFKWRWKKGQEPNGIYPKVFQIIKFRNQSREISNAITIAVAKCTHTYLVDNCFFKP